jgi:outer membrane lipoprotein SlyB
MKLTIVQLALITSLSVGVLACASQRPVLSPNDHLMRVGASAAGQEIDECMARAEAAITEVGTSGENVVAGAATSSAVGAAAGAAGGAVVGEAAQGAAAGAAGGAVAGITQALLHGLFRSTPPDPTYRQSVDRCLRERGYEPLGWR